MELEHHVLSLLAVTTGIVSAKWAMELGFSQLWQILWGIGGLLLGPLALLTLYVRLVRNRQELKEFGGQWVYGSAAAGWHGAAGKGDQTAALNIESEMRNAALRHKA